MREIKFRAWIHNPENISEGFMTYDFYMMKDNQCYSEGDIFDLDDSCKPMQYTNKKDRIGNDVYEGDILEFDPEEWGSDKLNKWEVKWDFNEGGWDLGGGSNRETSEWKTVIGNIYENPELLQSK